jgi:HlyD family secretion protein
MSFKNFHHSTFMSKYVMLLTLMVYLAGCAKHADSSISGSGTIEATEVNVASKIPATISQLRVDEGSRVKTGDTIAIVDHTNLDLQLKEAEANVAAVRSQVALLQHGARTEDIHSAQDAVSQAASNRKLAEEDFRRIQGLQAAGAGTKELLDQTQTRLDVAKAQEQSAKANLQKVQNITRPEDLQQVQARLQQAEATRDRVAQTIADCFITSPLAGIVTHKVVEQGEVVGAGATIATITETDKVDVMIYVTEEELAHVKLGERAKVTIDGMPGKTFDGKVAYISPEAEFTPKNIQTKDDRVKLVFGVKVEVPNTADQLKRGLPADAVLVGN